jgi:putative Mn2+ efflux pump MntP
MSLLEIFLVGIGLSMDAFAVAVCKGLGMEKVRARDAGLIALYFGVFQGLMPLIGWFLGSQFARYVTKWAPWISFVLLAYIGVNMIRESRAKDTEEKTGLRHRDLLVLAVATSIDALAVGVTFSFLELALSIGWAVSLIAVTTFVISIAGVYIGNVFGARYKSRAELTGGVILILIGIKILLEHFGVL